MLIPTGQPRRLASSGTPARRRALAAGLALATAALTLGTATGARAETDATPLPKLVTVDNVRAHMENLQIIADFNEGNRAHGTSGYDISAAYVMDQLERAGYQPTKHTYIYEYWTQLAAPFLTMRAPKEHGFIRDEDFLPLEYAASGDVTARGVLVAAGSDTSGCAAEDFTGFPKGAIAIMKRGTCTFEAKTANAAEAGAAAAVIINHGATDEPADVGPIRGTVSNLSRIPVVGVSVAAGERLRQAGEQLRLRVRIKSEIREESSYNVLAETPQGRADNVVLVGGHLDSAPASPGINDNASGSAAILEVAKQFAEVEQPVNKVRFAFWGTEEQGLVGSTKYVESRSEQERANIALYLNFDMLGSPNYGRFVYDGRGELAQSTTPPAGSAAIQKMFEDYFANRSLATEATPFSGRSDYSAFMAAGIPAGGLFSGGGSVKTERQVKDYGGVAGEEFDPNYHTPNDDITNINWESVDQMSDGVAHAVAKYSQSTLPVNGVLREQRAPGEVAFARQGDVWLR
ncbi:M20/M25/M40 family metallo-hydrolase [Salinactinospora qingdaonensis]|uniref:Aminopeptidase PaaP n=1 Tax=Salinactinospora qingdaonensis TaxID=702744 RepID=A0ABP7FSU7_9ACTN